MLIEIKSINGEVLFSRDVSGNSIKITLELAVKSGANLSNANLSNANLSDADLSHATYHGYKLTNEGN